MPLFKNPRRIACHQFWHCFSPKILHLAFQNCFKNRSSHFHYFSLFFIVVHYFSLRLMPKTLFFQYFFSKRHHHVCPQERKRTPKELRASRSVTTAKIHTQRPGRAKTVWFFGKSSMGTVQKSQKCHKKQFSWSNWWKTVIFTFWTASITSLRQLEAGPER